MSSVQERWVQYAYGIALRRLQPWLVGKVAPSDELRAVHQKNTDTLSRIPSWIEDATLADSIFSYGLPASDRHKIDLPIGDALTYSDWMVDLGKTLKAPVRYLEIGVSVGKNFTQMAHALHPETMVAIDIEAINPTLSALLGTSTLVEEWPSPPDSLKKSKSSVYQFDPSVTDGEIRYISGDIWDFTTWTQLPKRPFNLVFSDALHTPEALRFEMDRLVHGGRLDPDEFFIFWDDLTGSMQRTFFGLSGILKRHFSEGQWTRRLVRINGWLGQNEGPHTVGMIHYQRHPNPQLEIQS